MKGQVGNIGISIVMAAVFIIVGVLIFTQVYSSTPGINRIIINETKANSTVGGGWTGYGTFYESQTDYVPVYIGDLLAGGETNMTMMILNATTLSWETVTYVNGSDLTLGQFNYTQTGAIKANMSRNGSVVITYTRYGTSELYQPTYRNIQTQALNASQLLAVSAIVLAAVTILSLLFVLGRRA